MDTEPVVFGSAVEGMAKAFSKQFTPEVRLRLASMGVDLSNIQVAYPADVWVAVVRTVGDALAGELPERNRYVQIGRQFMRGFVQTGVGFAALAAGKLVGVRRTLLRMGRNFRTASNYVETDFAEVGPKELIIHTWIKDAYLAKIKDRSTLILEYRQGVLQEVIAQLGAQGTVEVVSSDVNRHDGRFRATWE